MSYPPAKCRVSGGSVRSLKTHRPLSTFRSHNFTDRVEVLLPKKSSSSAEKWFELFSQSKCYRLKGHVGLLLNETLLGLVRSSDNLVKLVSDTGNDLDPIVVSIINNKLCLTLDRNNSLQTGIGLKKSQFKGADRFDLVLDLTKKDLSSDTVFLKILKFFQSTKEAPSNFILSVTTQDFVPIPLKNEELSSLKLFLDVEEEDVTLKILEFPNMSVIDLQIAENDPEWALQVLEYLSYLSIGGQQLSEDVDPFLSQYTDSVDFVAKEDIVKLSFESLIIPSAYIIESLLKNFDDGHWIAILVHGRPNTNYSFNMSEHIVHESGENNTCYLQDNGKYVLWEITGGRDNH